MQKFETGAVRSSDGMNERLDLVPALGVLRVSRVSAEGAAKYGAGNWLKGIPVSNLVSRALRHLLLFLTGDASEDHLGHAAWNVLAAITMSETRPDMNDVCFQNSQMEKSQEAHPVESSNEQKSDWWKGL